MTRLLKLATIFLFSLFSIASLTSAQIVKEINTLLGPITQGATVPVTWSLQADAKGKMGVLSAQENSTKNTITIDQQVPLAPESYMWTVKVPPGSYIIAINDGSGLKQSAPVEIIQGSGGSDSTPSTKDAGTSSAASSPAAAAAAPTASSIGGAAANAPSTTSPSSSASSIFSGYDVIYSLLGVAIAMVQF